MKLIFTICGIILLMACHKNPGEISQNGTENYIGMGPMITTIDFRIMDENENDLLWGETKVFDKSDIEVFHYIDGKKKLYFRQGVIAPWIHGFEIFRAKENEEWIDGNFLRLYLTIPDSPNKPESITYLRLKQGKKYQEFKFKAEFKFVREEGTSIMVLKTYLNNELFWETTDSKLPVLIVKK